jgi:transcriptional regulator with XRE-family HTH domain
MRRRRLAAELHRLRAVTHLTLEEVADHLECSPAKISRIENGQVAVRIQDARELLELYEVEEAQQTPLLEMVRQARGKGWWSQYGDILSESRQTLLSLEDEASSILVFETNVVIDLLQTRHYARGVISSRPDLPLAQVERMIDLQMARQRILDRAHAPRLTVVLDEASLRRQVSTADVMLEQYERLIDAGDQIGIDLHVLPFDAGAHQAMGFPFHLFRFIDGDPELAYVELLNGGQVLETAEEVGRYRAAFDQVHDRALSAADSQRFLSKLTAELR